MTITNSIKFGRDSIQSYFLKYPVISLFFIAFIFRAVLIFCFPVVTGGDTVGRLLHREEALYVHWLPVTQTMVKYLFILFKTLIGVRIGLAVFGSLFVISFYALLRIFYKPKDAYFGALFYSFTPMVVFLGSIPYQETMFMMFIISSLLRPLHGVNSFP